MRAGNLDDVLGGLRQDYPQAMSGSQLLRSSTGTQILQALQQLFQEGLFESDSAFRQWLESRGIPSELFSY